MRNVRYAPQSAVFTMHFHPAFDARMIHDEHRRWNHRHAEPLGQFIEHINGCDPDRRLRIGIAGFP